MTRDRQDFQDHLTLRGLSADTIRAYVHWMVELCKFIGKRAGQIVEQDVRAFLVYLVKDREYAYETVRQARAALKTYFMDFKARPDVVDRLPSMNRKRRLPEPFSREEVGRFLQAASGPLHRM